MTPIKFPKAKNGDSGFIILWDEDSELALRLDRMSIEEITRHRKIAIDVANKAILKAMRASK